MRTVLVIDRYVAGRRTLCECIAELGHVAIEAESEADARASLASAAIDLIIATCDDEPTRSLLAELHDRAPTIPAIVVSSGRERWAALPDDARFVTQPLSLDGIERLIRESVSVCN
jgi:DNA-binding NtrC family response regulator